MTRVLLAVDVQKGFVSPSSEHVLKPIETVQHRFDHVIFSRYCNPEGSPFRTILKYDQMAPDEDDTHLAIVARTDALIYDKPGYSAFNDTLLNHLRGLAVSEVWIAGIATEACVLKTVMDLFEAGIVPWVIADLCASDKEHRFHDMAISIIGTLVGPHHIVNSEGLSRTAA